MRRWKWIFYFAGLAAVILSSGLQARVPQNPSDFFNPADMMTIGVYYYPEAWPESQWPRDIANIKNLGLEFVHMGEFAWAFMEPEEGKFSLDWLARNVELCRAQGLKVVLCTPSPTPPVWLVRKHPQVLMVDERGRRMNHGTREQACWSVDVYRKYVAGIVAELGRRFGQDPAVIGWQIDNEVSHYDAKYCYCPSCQKKFRAWLKKKYATVENLNRDWGTAFWSERYQNFDQIDIPNQDELVEGINPHSLLDFQRWFSEEAADYIAFQADILRKWTKNQWITTNFMTLHKEVFPASASRSLDVVTWTLYPVNGSLGEGSLGFRLGDGARMSFMHDFLRPLKGLHGLMELQPGQINWAAVNPQPLPGAIRMWIMRAFASGAKLVCTYRYRQPLYGGELYHNGLADTDGVTPSFGGLEFSRAMTDVRLLRESFQPGAVIPPDHAARKTAFLYNVENRWDIDNHPQTDRWDTVRHLLRYYGALKSLGCPVDVITEDSDFSRYPFLIAPAYQLVDKNLVDRWTRFAENGGHLILTARTAQKDRRGHLWEAPWAGPIHELIGAKILRYDVLPEPLKAKVESLGKTHEWGCWGEWLEPQPGTAVLASYADQFYAGKAAAVTRRLGRGTVTYIGVETLQGELESGLVRGVYESAGVPVLNLDPQFFVDWRDGFWVATNFSSKKQTAPIPKGAKILIGTKEVDPGGVVVWTD